MFSLSPEEKELVIRVCQKYPAGWGDTYFSRLYREEKVILPERAVEILLEAPEMLSYADPCLTLAVYRAEGIKGLTEAAVVAATSAVRGCYHSSFHAHKRFCRHLSASPQEVAQVLKTGDPRLSTRDRSGYLQPVW